MIVHKFGGAAVKDALGVRNLFSILKEWKEDKVIVVSALGKTTNELEILTKAIFENNQPLFKNQLEKIQNYHLQVANDLFSEKTDIHNEIDSVFQLIKSTANEKHTDYDFLYDQVVSLGEVLSTKIVSAYLNKMGLTTQWTDIRKFLITDHIYREANVNMDLSSNAIKKSFNYSPDQVILTQGFIGGTQEGNTTTLGREGSDYTAALLANILDAEKVVVWKDVPGILNADPRYFDETEKLDEISYQEAIELAFYGAKIIHPKTIKPLQNKSIPLLVKSFLDPASDGTLISGFESYTQGKPVFIVKTNQILISVVPKDFSFVFEERLSKIYHLFAQHRIKVNVIQNSAINFTVSADENNPRISQLLDDLRREFRVLYNSGLELITIRHYTEEAVKKVLANRKVLIEQRSRHTAQFLIQNSLT
jgi:aspartate kinase